MQQSCHTLCQYFSTRWQKTAMKQSSSSCISCATHFSSATLPSIPVATAMRRLGMMYSIGITASFPYTNLNGVFPINLLKVVRYADITKGIFKCQSSRLALHTFVSACSNILLNASTIPFSYRWYGVLFLCCIYNSYVSTLTVRFMKWLPCSLINILGHPDCVTMLSNRNLDGFATVQSTNGVASSHLVK